MENKIIIRKYFGINVVRDDFLAGGTKSVLMPAIVDPTKKYVYASPVYGGFQIALSAYCGKNAIIFCDKRKQRHENTQICEDYGAKIVEVPVGYLSVVEARAREYAERTGAIKLLFGAKEDRNINIISDRVREAIKQLKKEPDEIWCAIGSGTLVTAILRATTTAKVIGVQVGQDCNIKDDRLTVLKYHKSFDKPSLIDIPFKSTANYDRKAFEYCIERKGSGSILFWNVL